MASDRAGPGACRRPGWRGGARLDLPDWAAASVCVCLCGSRPAGPLCGCAPAAPRRGVHTRQRSPPPARLPLHDAGATAWCRRRCFVPAPRCPPAAPPHGGEPACCCFLRERAAPFQARRAPRARQAWPRARGRLAAAALGAAAFGRVVRACCLVCAKAGTPDAGTDPPPARADCGRRDKRRGRPGCTKGRAGQSWKPRAGARRAAPRAAGRAASSRTRRRNRGRRGGVRPEGPAHARACRTACRGAGAADPFEPQDHSTDSAERSTDAAFASSSRWLLDTIWGAGRSGSADGPSVSMLSMPASIRPLPCDLGVGPALPAHSQAPPPHHEAVDRVALLPAGEVLHAQAALQACGHLLHVVLDAPGGCGATGRTRCERDGSKGGLLLCCTASKSSLSHARRPCSPMQPPCARMRT
jgi:hypothetical protein